MTHDGSVLTHNDLEYDFTGYSSLLASYLTVLTANLNSVLTTEDAKVKARAILVSDCSAAAKSIVDQFNTKKMEYFALLSKIFRRYGYRPVDDTQWYNFTSDGKKSLLSEQIRGLDLKAKNEAMKAASEMLSLLTQKGYVSTAVTTAGTAGYTLTKFQAAITDMGTESFYNDDLDPNVIDGTAEVVEYSYDAISGSGSNLPSGLALEFLTSMTNSVNTAIDAADTSVALSDTEKDELYLSNLKSAIQMSVSTFLNYRVDRLKTVDAKLSELFNMGGDTITNEDVLSKTLNDVSVTGKQMEGFQYYYSLATAKHLGQYIGVSLQSVQTIPDYLGTGTIDDTTTSTAYTDFNGLVEKAGLNL